MCRIVLLTCLFLAVSACTTRADVLYTLALTATDGSGINGTGSFTLSQLPQPPTAESTSVIRTYRPPYDQNPPDPYGDFLENMDFNIDGLHFFLDPSYPPFAFVTIDEYFGEDTSVVYPNDIFFQTNAPGPNPFVYLFDVSAGPNSYQYALYRDVGTGHSFSTTGTITITGIETVSAPTPEPSTLGLVGTGFAVILTTLRRRFT